MKEFEETGEHTFIFGYEESYGFLAGTFGRDKDAILSAYLIAEMAAYHKEKGETCSRSWSSSHSGTAIFAKIWFRSNWRIWLNRPVLCAPLTKSRR